MRQQCLACKPWLLSTGPRTAEGKFRSKANGWRHRPDPNSAQQARARVSDIHQLIAQMAELRSGLLM
jgi:hypothetical protein